MGDVIRLTDDVRYVAEMKTLTRRIERRRRLLDSEHSGMTPRMRDAINSDQATDLERLRQLEAWEARADAPPAGG